jgi:hypothetical protein
VTVKTLVLNYAGPTTRWWRCCIRRYLFPAIAILTVLYLGPANIRAAAQRAWRLYWQDQCLTHAAPNDRLVFESRKASERGSPPPLCWEAYSRLLTHPSGQTGQFGSAGTLVFLHARDNSEGDNRLVAVELVKAVRRSDQCDLHFRTRTVVPGTWRSPPGDGGWVPDVVSLSTPQAPSDDLRVYAAQADANDRCKFTLRCELGGQRFEIHASMCGDYVNFDGVVHLVRTDGGGIN